MSSDSVLAPAPADIRFDDGRHPRAKIGYVLLATEQTVQDDVLTLRPPGVGVHFTRAAIPDSITSESLAGTWPLKALPEAQTAFLQKQHVGNFVVIPKE